jgi:hypothetical protein
MTLHTVAYSIIKGKDGVVKTGRVTGKLRLVPVP